MKYLLIITISILLFNSCGSDNKQKSLDINTKSQNGIDETTKNLDSSSSTSLIIDVNPGIMVNSYPGNGYDLYVYTPNKLYYHLTNKRPGFNPNNYLSVAAAFTDSDLISTSGKLIIDGETIFKNNNPTLSGGCIIGNNSIKIIDKTNNIDSLIKSVSNNHESYFQQALLVYKNKSIVWNLDHGDLKVQRRALIEFNNQFSICESSGGVDVETFTLDLIKLGVKNAIYLDMGGWSEGWYKSVDGKQISIGGKNASKSQINWLYLSK